MDWLIGQGISEEMKFGCPPAAQFHFVFPYLERWVLLVVGGSPHQPTNNQPTTNQQPTNQPPSAHDYDTFGKEIQAPEQTIHNHIYIYTYRYLYL